MAPTHSSLTERLMRDINRTHLPYIQYPSRPHSRLGGLIPTRIFMNPSLPIPTFCPQALPQTGIFVLFPKSEPLPTNSAVHLAYIYIRVPPSFEPSLNLKRRERVKREREPVRAREKGLSLNPLPVVFLMSRVGLKSVVFHGESCLGEAEIFPTKDPKFPFPNNEIRITHLSPASERCPPLSILQTISPFSIPCKLESKSPALNCLHSSCSEELKV